MPTKRLRLLSNRWFRWTALAACLLALLVGVRMADRYRDIAGLQAYVGRNYEIVFNAWGKPDILPEFINRIAEKQISRKHGATHGTTNLDVLTRERFWGMFRGRIHTIETNYPYRFSPGIGAALAEFPHLRKFVVYDPGRAPSEAGEVDELFAAIAGMRSLETLKLSGSWISGERLEAIGTLPELQHLTLSDCDFTPASFEWVGAQPELKSVDLSQTIMDSEEPLLGFARRHPTLKIIHPAITTP